jgi:hypothetical protein
VILIVAVGLLLVLVAVGAWQWVTLLLSVYQWFLDRSASSRSGVSPSCSLPGEGDSGRPELYEPDADLSSSESFLSSLSTARCTADLESAAALNSPLARRHRRV